MGRQGEREEEIKLILNVKRVVFCGHTGLKNWHSPETKTILKRQKEQPAFYVPINPMREIQQVKKLFSTFTHLLNKILDKLF